MNPKKKAMHPPQQQFAGRPNVDPTAEVRNYGILDALNDMEVSIGQARSSIDSLQQKLGPICRPIAGANGESNMKPAEGSEVINRIRVLQNAIDNLTGTIDTIRGSALI